MPGISDGKTEWRSSGACALSPVRSPQVPAFLPMPFSLITLMPLLSCAEAEQCHVSVRSWSWERWPDPGLCCKGLALLIWSDSLGAFCLLKRGSTLLLKPFYLWKHCPRNKNNQERSPQPSSHCLLLIWNFNNCIKL